MHIQFTCMFSGPLKDKSDEKKSLYLMIWVGPQGREVFGTWDLSNDAKKDPIETGNQNRTMYSINTNFSAIYILKLNHVTNL